ncbi:hypothetical protein Tco_0498654, partial [Tanacetum coccineum]
MRGNRQRVPFEFFINNDRKYLKGGVSTMTYTTSTTKLKATKYALWGISQWREQCKSFYAYARGIQSRGDVYSMKRILTVTHVKVIRKHGYGYLEEIVVRRANNVLYRFKDGDFLRLWISDIEDMLILLVRIGLEIFQGFDTPAGNPIKKILLKLNLSDHRSILTDSKEYLKMVMERQSVKVKEIKERCIIKAFQDYQIKK